MPTILMTESMVCCLVTGGEIIFVMLLCKILERLQLHVSEGTCSNQSSYM